jgi:hypothetical protein
MASLGILQCHLWRWYKDKVCKLVFLTFLDTVFCWFSTLSFFLVWQRSWYIFVLLFQQKVQLNKLSINVGLDKPFYFDYMSRILCRSAYACICKWILYDVNIYSVSSLFFFSNPASMTKRMPTLYMFPFGIISFT